MELLGPGLSAGGALMNLFGGGGPPQPAPVWHPPGMNTAAGNITNQIGQNVGNNVPAQLMPQYQSTVAGLNNNPGAGGFMGGANAGQAYGMNAAGQAAGGGDYLQQLAHAIGMNAFDPQNALYGRTQQQLQEQIRAGSEARGIDNTPYGAGVENKGMSDFNIDWQNNLLQRMIGGGGAAGNLMNSGVNLSGMAPGMAYQAGQMPWQAFNTMGQNQLGNLDRLAQAGITSQQIPNTAISQWQNYINSGNQANQVSNQNAQVAGQNNQVGFLQNQIVGGQLGQAANALSRTPQYQGWMNGGSAPTGRVESSFGDGGATGWG